MRFDGCRGQALGALMLLAAAPAEAAGSGTSPPWSLTLTELTSRDVPASIAESTDVRWAAGKQFVLSDYKQGVVLFDGGRNAIVRTVVPQGSQGGDHAFQPVHLGKSGDELAFAFALYDVGWHDPRRTPATIHEVFDSIEDLDLREGTVAVLGLRRDDKGEVARDGAYAWIWPASQKGAEPVAVLFARGGAGAPAFDSCTLMHLGSVRFLEDGSLLVVPGAEPGAFLLSPERKIVRVWDGAEIGVSVPCAAMSLQQRYQLSANEIPRASWLNGFRMVDDIVPIQGGGLVLVRFVDGQKTRWQGVLLGRDGTVHRVDFPYASESRFAHLRADVRGDRLVLLEFDIDDTTTHRARKLVTARWALVPPPAKEPAKPASAKVP